LEILKVHMRGRPMAADVNPPHLAQRMDGMASSEIAFICKNATMMAVSELIESGKPTQETKLLICAGRFREALETLNEMEGSSPC
jgi:SpoVK/Ycf46/Vps4 family AAA+-type ATPase